MANEPENAQKQQLKDKEQAYKSIFGGMTYQSMRSLQIQSIDWLIKKFKDAKVKDIATTRPQIGKMYLWIYKAKWAEKLPFWDAHPLTIVTSLYFNNGISGGAGFGGLNFHYLGLEQRLKLLGIITNFQDVTKFEKDRRFMMSYQKLKAAAETWVKFSYHRYLYSQLESKLIQIPITEWKNVLYLPISKFQKENKEHVQSIITGRKW